MIAAWMTIETDVCTTCPMKKALRRSGETSRRSTTPRLRSSIVAIPFQPPEKKAVMTTTPGARNWM